MTPHLTDFLAAIYFVSGAIILIGIGFLFGYMVKLMPWEKSSRQAHE